MTNIQMNDIMKNLIEKFGKIEVISDLSNTIIEGRYKVTKSLSSGAFGKIYTAFDLNSKVDGVFAPLIVKFTKNHSMNDKEY
jgi:hypothetical protein